MEQKGYVTDIVDFQTAKVLLQRESAWAKCGKCFGSKTSESQELEIEADNKIGAQKGDLVEITVEHINVMKALWIMYGIPLIALMIGTIGSYYVFKNVYSGNSLEMISFIIGLVFMAIAFIGIKLKDAKFKASREYLPIITRILIDKE